MTTATGGTAAKTAASRTRTVKDTPAPEASAPKSTSLEGHLGVLQEGDVLSPSKLHGFLESMRALSTAMAFFAEAASTQIEAAMRKGARDSADGRLTLADKARLKLVLRQVNRGLETAVKDALLDAARGSVKAYAHMEAFLEELETTHADRPHRRTGGGFDLFGNR